jgi:uncharacterized protein (TIGR00369 family)
MDAESLTAAGWQQSEAGGFTGYFGALWSRSTGDEHLVGMIVEPRHSNNHLGTVHGGVLMTLADLGLGIGVGRALGGPACVTISLQTQFVATAQIGEFLVCRPEVVRRSKSLVFVRGLICVDDRIVASSDGIWKVLEPRPGN